LRCLYVTQELAPYFTDGGLGQAARALPEALHLYHGIAHEIILPYYPWLVERAGLRTEPVAELPPVTFAGTTAASTVERLTGHDGPVAIFLLRADRWYARDGIYRDHHHVEFPDAAVRAAFFGDRVAEWVVRDSRRYDIVHANDWQSGAALAHLRSARGTDALPALLLNVHTAAYRGEVVPSRVATLGLPTRFQELLRRAAPGSPSLLLLALLAADMATTGSRTYARQLRNEFADTPLGDALASIELTGIVAGVDPLVWNPAVPGQLPQPFDAQRIDDGKRANKVALQERLGLKVNPCTPVFGVCTRLVEEKGLDLTLAALRPLVAVGAAQLVIVGFGDERYHRALADLTARHPNMVHHAPGFDQETAWLVYAGSDFTLMPSRVEPCGLNQLIAMAYATIPLVSAVGGLCDTVVDLGRDPEHGTGFVIADLTVEGVGRAVDAATDWLRSQPRTVRAVRRRLMSQDWSWRRTARETAELYDRAVAARQGSAEVGR
jgi:starch synthase